MGEYIYQKYAKAFLHERSIFVRLWKKMEDTLSIKKTIFAHDIEFFETFLIFEYLYNLQPIFQILICKSVENILG